VGSYRSPVSLITAPTAAWSQLNIGISAALCLLPFAAGLLGRYDREPVALRIYGLMLMAIAVMRVVMVGAQPPAPAVPAARRRQRRAGLAWRRSRRLVYLLAILVAATALPRRAYDPTPLPRLYFLNITVLRSDRKRDQEYADFTCPIAGSGPRRLSQLILGRVRAVPCPSGHAGAGGAQGRRPQAGLEVVEKPHDMVGLPCPYCR
jgi:hypothetical protein